MSLAIFQIVKKIISLDFKSRFSILNCSLKLRRIIKQYKADVVHSHLFMSTLVARISCPKKVKFIFSVHNTLSQDAFNKNSLSKFIESLTYTPRQTAIFVSRSVAEDYKQYIGLRGKYFILYNFIEDVYFESFVKRTRPHFPIRLVSVGNLREQKNYFFLLVVLSSMERNIFELDIYGDGPLKHELEKFIVKHKLPVILRGKASNISSILKNYDAFIMPSLYEGYGIALVEAMANGLPLIISDIPVFREVSSNNGLFFNPHDKNSLSKILKDISVNKIDFSFYSTKGLKLAKKIADKSAYIEKLTNIYFS